MVPHELIGIRNIVLMQMAMIVLVPGHLLLVRQELLRIWRSINSPFLHKREDRKKTNRFWEIDMSDFEP
jgi:hypothetical protein